MSLTSNSTLNKSNRFQNTDNLNALTQNINRSLKIGNRIIKDQKITL